MTSNYFLGVDGGQTSTTAIIGDDTGRVLGTGRGGPVGPADFINAVTTSLGAACSEAGLDAGSVRFASACLGFSGGAADKKAILGQILASDRMIVTDDAVIALTGALAGEPGIVVIAGTGSIAFGRNAQGQTARAGGWGYLFGDEGGGFWIVREAMRAALRWEEGWGPPTALRAMFLDATGARNMNDLIHRCYTAEFPRARIAGLSLRVNYVVENGDPVAREILGEGAREVARLGHAIRRQLFEPTESVRCAYVGGVFHSRTLLSRFRDEVERQPALIAAPPIHDPALGALLEAYREVGAIPYGIRQPFLVRPLG
jgi:N-acetylglucosamine kinase-like BadF-type ATPase